MKNEISQAQAQFSWTPSIQCALRTALSLQSILCCFPPLRFNDDFFALEFGIATTYWVFQYPNEVLTQLLINYDKVLPNLPRLNIFRADSSIHPKTCQFYLGRITRFYKKLRSYHGTISFLIQHEHFCIWY